MKLIQDTYQQEGLDMSLTRVFEAHGTGTAVGDPLEAMAIADAFGLTRANKNPMVMYATNPKETL